MLARAFQLNGREAANGSISAAGKPPKNAAALARSNLVARVVAFARPDAGFGACFAKRAHFVARDHTVAIAVDVVEAFAEAGKMTLRFVAVKSAVLILVGFPRARAVGGAFP